MKRPSWRTYPVVSGLILIGSLALAACSPTVPATATKPSPTPTATQSPQALDILRHVAMANLQNAHVAINASANTQNGNVATTSTGTMAFNPFQADLTTTGTYLAQPLNAEEIVSGNTLYVKMGTSTTWQAYSLDQIAASTAIDPSNFSPEKITQLANVRVVGIETVDGVKVYHLQGTGRKTIAQLTGAGAALGALGSDANQPVTYTADLDVRTDTYQPVRFQAHAAAGPTTADVTAVFTAWNMGVTITPPPASQVTNP
jgi:hypothetical protein